MTIPLIKTEQDLKDFFLLNRDKKNSGQKKRFDAGVFVDSKLRKTVLIGEHQGKFILDGRVVAFDFKNCGGGVWNVTVKD